ncbi:ionotropic receptor 93a-like [Mya arenaria]|uniref:ionotropic receptor 93a-like n=1 Tax=Mya arenaria TaxID=6604 RepID=UPI0022E5E7A2|nr:ionotropic receptor 93a-like [Mya arenaria]
MKTMDTMLTVLLWTSTLPATGQALYRIGILHQGTSNLDVKNLTVGEYTSTLLWFGVDMLEPFQLQKAVNNFETHHTPDVIIVLNDEHHEAVDTSLLYARTPLIQWGRRPPFSPKHVEEDVIEGQDLCDPLYEATSRQTAPYCYTDAQLDNLKQQVNNNTLIMKEIVVRVPLVVSNIIVKALKWQSVFIFYDISTSQDVRDLVDDLSNNAVKVITFNVDQIEDITDVLLRAYNTIKSAESHINFAVLCRYNCIRRVLNKANKFDQENGKMKSLLKMFSRWLVAAYEHNFDTIETMTSCASNIDNLAVIAFPEITPSTSIKESLNTTLTSFFNDMIIDEKLYTSAKDVESANSSAQRTENLIKLLHKDSSTWYRESKCAALRIDTLMWTPDGRGFSHVGYVKHQRYNDTNHWSLADIAILSDVFPNIHFAYNKRQFLVSTLHYEPFVIKTVENGTSKYGGICMDLLKELAKNLNFTYNLTEPDDQKWGSTEDMINPQFNGLIGQLQREEVDIVAADISIQKEREMVMDFMFPFFYGSTSVVIKKPDPNRRKWRTLVDPFKGEVLAFIGVVLLAASVIGFLFERFNPFYCDPDNARLRSETYGLHTIHDAFWYMYGALLSQGGVNLPESNAGRTFVSCWWLFCIVIVATYCGNLIAFLAVSKEPLPFNTLEEMAKFKDEYKWGIQAGTNWEVVFKTSKRKEFRAIGDAWIEFNKTDPDVTSTDFNVHMAKVKEGYYGWIGDTVVIEMAMDKDCDLLMIKERFLPIKYAFGFTNNSPHAQIFSKQMLSMLESGLIQVWKRRWWPKSKVICPGSVVTVAKPISVVDVQSAFYVAGGGAVLGLLAFLMELLVVRVQKYFKSKHPTSTRSSNDPVRVNYQDI